LEVSADDSLLTESVKIDATASLVGDQTAREHNNVASKTSTDSTLHSRPQSDRSIDDDSDFSLQPDCLAPEQQQPVQVQKERFGMIREHAKGGLGVVYVARDNDLDRNVAIKEIKSSLAKIEDAKNRFEFEARITGGLEHPCIVPVYAYGVHREGQPYYAMRFISGEPLKETIKRFHGDTENVGPAQSLAAELPSLGSRFYSSDFRNLLTRLIDTCNGIAFAHSRGVLHRDIKPSNIMLGKYGETLVVDWGLAKYIGREEDISLTSPIPADTSGSSPIATLDGTTIGTPPFMSPEQAAGNLQELAIASDIYSLGSVLYVIITGKLPYSGKSIKDVIEKVKVGDFQPPSAVVQQLPKSLEAICLKAMAFEQDQRYSSALKLADDLDLFLAGEPVSAYVEPPFVRFQRWIRKHQRVATATAAVLLTTTVAALVGLAFVNAERQRTHTALIQLKTEQEKTVAALHAKSQAIELTGKSFELITDRVVGQVIARNEQIDKTDQQLIADISQQFEQFTRVEGNTDVARRLRADGFRRVGDLNHRIGQSQIAQTSYSRARTLLLSLLDVNSQDVESILNLAAIESNSGYVHANEGDFHTAIKCYTKSLELFESLSHQNTDAAMNNSIALQHTQVLTNRGNNQDRLGKMELAEQDYLAAERLLSDSQQQTVLKKLQRARLDVSYASLLNRTDRIAESIHRYRKSIQIYDRLRQESAGDTEILYELASAQSNLGLALLRSQEIEQAESSLSRAVANAQSLVDQYPGFQKNFRLLASCLSSHGLSLAKSDHQAAVQSLTTATKIWEDLLAKTPESIWDKQSLAASLGNLAKLHGTSHPQRAANLFEQQLDLLDELEKANQPDAIWKDERIAAQTNFANFLRDRHSQPARAEKIYRGVLAVLDAQPDDQLTAQKLAIRRKVVFGLADCAGRQQKFDSALAWWTQLTADRNDPNWSAFESQRIICLLRTGQLKLGLQAAEKRLASKPTPGPIDYYDIACWYAIAYSVDRESSGSSPADSIGFAEKAIVFLGQAADGGLFEKPRFRKHAAADPDLDALRTNQDFIKFCERHQIK
jgi:serine/threonine-protein kinase